MDDDWGVALFQDTPTKKRNITRRYQEMDCEDIYSFNMFKKNCIGGSLKCCCPCFQPPPLWRFIRVTPASQQFDF